MTSSTSSASGLQYITIAPATDHTATIIFIHGLGDSGWGWEPVANQFKKDPTLDHIKWILPHAGRKSITAMDGKVIPAWFDVISYGNDAVQDEEGLLESSNKIKSLIAEEIARGTPPNRIVLGGFSQGGAITSLTGFTTENKLAGLVVLSGRLPIRQKVKSMVSEHAKTLPIFWAHGDDDQLVELKRVTDARDFMKSELFISDASGMGSVGLSFNVYKGMGHTTSDRELDDLTKWLNKVIPK